MIFHGSLNRTQQYSASVLSSQSVRVHGTQAPGPLRLHRVPAHSNTVESFFLVNIFFLIKPCATTPTPMPHKRHIPLRVSFLPLSHHRTLRCSLPRSRTRRNASRYRSRRPPARRDPSRLSREPVPLFQEPSVGGLYAWRSCGAIGDCGGFASD